ncbi:hypothetical protein [Conexibacter sp. DBS9H8]|uniref:hypothetical protein n=1 Tax=Conexibacter sp. DBS9H8 TaxID=2937801 RepID=UPI00200DE43A|nr:hypothetical protein [Conexibacter sp. DBS9H8]
MTYRERTRAIDAAARHWDGPYRPYDLIKEATIAVTIVGLIAVTLAILFSSPDEAPTTIRSWSRQNPVDFVSTAMGELDGTSTTAEYGPPYDHGPKAQHLAFIHLQSWLGIAHPINTAQDYVLGPLAALPGQPALRSALATYRRAGSARQLAWDHAYERALTKVADSATAIRAVHGPNLGPVPTLMDSLLSFAQGGGLDGALLANRQFYSTDYTKILMLLADGGALASRARAEHLLGNQWGMMNETGSFPGQGWLWLYTMWYQIKPFSTSPNADIMVMAVMFVLSLGFVLVPFLPGVRDLPRLVPVYRLIWREHYRSTRP